MTDSESLATGRLALDAVSDPKAPAPLARAAGWFIASGDPEPFRRLLFAGASAREGTSLADRLRWYTLR